MNAIKCPICGQTSEMAYCPYCGMKLQPTEEEQKIEEKQQPEYVVYELRTQEKLLKKNFLKPPNRVSRKQLRNKRIVIFAITQIIFVLWGILTNWTFFSVNPPMPVEYSNNASADVIVSEGLTILYVIVILCVILIIAMYILVNSNVPKYRRR